MAYRCEMQHHDNDLMAKDHHSIQCDLVVEGSLIDMIADAGIDEDDMVNNVDDGGVGANDDQGDQDDGGGTMKKVEQDRTSCVCDQVQPSSLSSPSTVDPPQSCVAVAEEVHDEQMVDSDDETMLMAVIRDADRHEDDEDGVDRQHQ